MLQKVLEKQFSFCHYLLKENLEGISHEASLVRPEPAGNCLNWIVGHIVSSRSSFLPLLGQEELWDAGKAAPYKRDADPSSDSFEPIALDEILADLDRSQKRLLAGLPSLTPERQSEPSPINPFHQKEETLGGLFTGLAFHEAYHVGQTGILRRMAGLDRTV
ncbi:MAG: DinB family protein [Acidobacteria bacterium]|nr:DinB family protein [Acidobacteriota bacterium]